MRPLFFIITILCFSWVKAELNGIKLYFHDGTSQIVPYTNAEEITFSSSDICFSSLKFPLLNISRYEFCETPQFVGFNDINLESISIDTDGIIQLSTETKLTNTTIYDIKGRICAFYIKDNCIDCSSLPYGVYILTYNGNKFKFFKN